ncbi:MAG: hypothetical protein AAGG72_03320, partial [Pseudomonadota bacterium]
VGSNNEPSKILIRRPQLFRSRWFAVTWTTEATCRLQKTRVRNAITTYELELRPADGREMLLTLNSAAMNLDAMSAIAPAEITEFREASQEFRLHYDLP